MSPSLDCIILARGGSKGVPGKNVTLVGGRPCIAWTIDAAAACAGVGTIIVSSDDPVALEVARKMGVATHQRPEKLATDTARVDDAARDCAIAMRLCGPTEQEPSSQRDLQAQPKPQTSVVILLYANVPVRPPDLLTRATSLFHSSGCDSVQSYAPVGKYHPYWMVRIEDDQTSFSGCVKPWQGEVLNNGIYRRQELPPAYIPDGGVLIVSYPALQLQRLERGSTGAGPHDFLGIDRRGITSPGGEVVDIDSPIDLLVADALLMEQTLRTPVHHIAA